MNESTCSMPSEPLPDARREERGAAVGAVDVEPQPPLATHVAMPSRSSIVPAFVEPALATTANGPAGSARSSAAAQRRAGQAAALVVGDREHVDVHHARRRRHRRVRRVARTRSASAPGVAAARLGGCVARRDQRRQVARRAARDEAAAAPAGSPASSASHPQRLVLRPHRARALEPAPAVDVGRAHREVEQDAGLASGRPGRTRGSSGGRWRWSPARARPPRCAAPPPRRCPRA